MEYNIGFNPETNQNNWGNPQLSAFGNTIRGGFAPYNGVNYEWFVWSPYQWPKNFYGRQVAGAPVPEFLYGEYWGYRGILPYGLMSPSPEPYPWQLGYPYNQSP